MIASDKDGKLNEILNQTEVKISLDFLLKLSTHLFNNFDVDEDEVISDVDMGNENFGRRLISFPAPIFKFYTRLDEDRNNKIKLEEIHNFLKRTFAMIDENEDCLVDLTEILAVLDASKLPKDFQLGLKLLAQHQIILGNHAFNRIFQVADSNQDNQTEVEEILKFSDFDFIESEAQELLILGEPDMSLIQYLTGDSTSYREEEAKEVWLETFQKLMMNDAYEMELSNLKCG